MKMNPLLLLLILCLLLPVGGAAQEIATVTLVEGALQVVRGAAVLQAAEGVRLRQGDILESPAAGFIQLEFVGGTIVALGPSSRAYLLSHPAARGGATAGEKTSAAEMVLLSGWLKGETPKTGTYRYDTPLLAASTRDGTVLAHASAEGVEIFVESGSAEIGEISPEGNWRAAGTARAGQFFTRRAGKSVTTQARPTPAFVESMPPSFRDTLPSRVSRFAEKRVEPKRDHEVTYSEIQPWLTIGHTWRKGFVRRFQPRLKDAAFRNALDAHMNMHPEWDPVVHPEKYEPKAAPANSKPVSPPGSQSP
jgi:hypothetical protein